VFLSDNELLITFNIAHQVFQKKGGEKNKNQKLFKSLK
jgi:hypothetical protein